MPVLKILGLAVLAAIVIVLVLAANKPATFNVERTVVVRAPPAKIFPLIDDFHRWEAWSPWEGLDPDMKKKFTGPDQGVGAIYEWEGNGKVGAGRMEITRVQEPSKTVVKLDFIKPFEGHNIAEFTLVPQYDSTVVIWAMSGPNRYVGKIMQVFFDMDRMIGKDFEKGLANLKTVAEK